MFSPSAEKICFSAKKVNNLIALEFLKKKQTSFYDLNVALKPFCDLMWSTNKHPKLKISYRNGNSAEVEILFLPNTKYPISKPS